MRLVLTKKTKARRVLARLQGLGGFVALEAGASAEFVEFKKDVLRLGTFVLDDGEVLDVTLPFMEESCRNTNKWIAEAGHKVWLPNGHTSDALENHGEWKPTFAVEKDPKDGDLRAFGTVRVPKTDPAASKLGKTINDVSAGIRWGALASNGTTFDGPVFEHVCITPNPVITGQGGFVPCAREAKSREEAMKLSKEARARFVALAGAAPEASAVTDDVARQVLAAGMGLPLDAPWEKVLAACLGDEEAEAEDAAGSAPAAGASAPDAAVMARFAKLDAELARTRTDRAKEIVQAARERCSVPLDRETCEEAQAYLAKGDAESEKLGRKLLDLEVKSKNAPVRGRVLTNPGGAGVDPKDKGATSSGGTAELSQDEKTQIRLAQSFPGRYAIELDRAGHVTKFSKRSSTRSA